MNEGPRWTRESWGGMVCTLVVLAGFVAFGLGVAWWVR